MQKLMDFLNSKKALMAVAGIVVAVGGRFGLDLAVEDVTLVVYVISAYIVGQGLADAGKEAMKVERGEE